MLLGILCLQGSRIMIESTEFSCQQSHEIGSWSEHVLILSSLFGNSPFLESVAPTSSSSSRAPCSCSSLPSDSCPDVLIQHAGASSSSALAKPVSRLRVSMNERHLLPQEASSWWLGSKRMVGQATSSEGMNTVLSKLESVFADLFCSLWPQVAVSHGPARRCLGP